MINLDYAKSLIGTPYVWGGDNDREGGLDCSGFLYNVLIKSGMSVNRDTAQGYYNKFKNMEVMRPIFEGDILFFGKSKNNITHVAIALNSTSMIESVGTKSNTIKNKGRGVSINLITRRKDLVAICRLYVKKEVPDIPAANPNLKVGSKGIQVERLQKCLNFWFLANLKTDGIFGIKTREALRKMQAASGLVADGIYGNHTRNVFIRLRG